MGSDSTISAPEAGSDTSPGAHSTDSSVTAAGVGLVFLRVIIRGNSLLGAHQLHIIPVIPRITTTGDAVNLAIEQRQSRMSRLSRLLAYLYTEVNIEETHFAQQSPTTDIPASPIQVAIFASNLHGELTQACRHPSLFQQGNPQTFAERYPEFLTSSDTTKALHVNEKLRMCAVEGTILWLLVTVYALGHVGGSIVGFQTIVAANIIAGWVHLRLKEI